MFESYTKHCAHCQDLAQCFFWWATPSRLKWNAHSLWNSIALFIIIISCNLPYFMDWTIKKIILAFRAVAPAIASIAFDFWFLRSSCPLFRALQPTCKWRNSSRKTQAATLYRTRWTCWSTSCSVGDKQMRLATEERYNFLLLMRGTIWKRKMQ